MTMGWKSSKDGENNNVWYEERLSIRGRWMKDASWWTWMRKKPDRSVDEKETRSSQDAVRLLWLESKRAMSRDRLQQTLLLLLRLRKTPSDYITLLAFTTQYTTTTPQHNLHNKLVTAYTWILMHWLLTDEGERSMINLARRMYPLLSLSFPVSQ